MQSSRAGLVGEEGAPGGLMQPVSCRRISQHGGPCGLQSGGSPSAYLHPGQGWLRCSLSHRLAACLVWMPHHQTRSQRRSAGLCQGEGLPRPPPLRALRQPDQSCSPGLQRASWRKGCWAFELAAHRFLPSCRLKKACPPRQREDPAGRIRPKSACPPPDVAQDRPPARPGRSEGFPGRNTSAHQCNRACGEATI